MRHADHRLSFGAAVALLPALILAASPAAAETARSQLNVGARVLPSCEVTTDGAGSAASSCTTGSDGSIAVGRGSAAPYPDRPANAPAAEADDSGPALTWITITY